MVTSVVFQSIVLLFANACLAQQVSNSSNEPSRSKRSFIFTPNDVCMGELGCFSFDGDFYHPIYRPFHLKPYSRERINTEFHLFTKRNPREPQYLKAHNRKSIESSYFDPKVDTKIIVHGFLEYWIMRPEWMNSIRDQYLINNDYNIIFVKWKGGNNLPYTQAVANTRVVGAELALFIQYLVNTTQASLSSIHIIGHSLGAHVAGYAGERVHGLERITGLDPAKLMFQHMPPKVRLDPTDAHLVDVIHSDTRTTFLLGLGIREPLGHIDYYPNGAFDHPGCPLERITGVFQYGLGQGFRKLVGCAHDRSVQFFSSSINGKDCQMVSYSCPSYETFELGRCARCDESGRYCPVLGWDPQFPVERRMANKSLSVFLKTRSDAPYCLVYYSVEVALAYNSGSGSLKGSIQLTLVGQVRSETIQLTASNEEFYHGSKHVFMVQGEEAIGELENVILQWTTDIKWYNPLTWFRKPLKMFIDSVEVKQMHMAGRRSVSRFCNQNPLKGISINTPLELNRGCKPQTF